MLMKKYQVLQSFKGSPNGAVTLSFDKDSRVDHSELGDDLAKVALDEKWIKEVKEEPKKEAKDAPENKQE